MLNVGDLGSCDVRIFKLGECHVWHSIFECKHYIWRVLFWRIKGASQNSHNKVLTKIKHSTVSKLTISVMRGSLGFGSAINNCTVVSMDDILRDGFHVP